MGKIGRTNNIVAGTGTYHMSTIVVAKNDTGVPTRKNKSNDKLIEGNTFLGIRTGRGMHGHKATTKPGSIAIYYKQPWFEVDGEKMRRPKE